MSTEQSQVVVAFDFSKSAVHALERSIALAARAPFHVLHFVAILDPHAGLAALRPSNRVDLAYADLVRGELVSAIEQELRGFNVGRMHFHVHVRIAKHPAKEILATARDVGADLIVVGCKGLTGVERIVLGSVSEHIVREAECAVVIARPKRYPYVPHEDVVEVEAQPGRHKSFRFTYDDHVGVAEPLRWPGA
jgi:nucleotide-binding universal stress UspA family protein